VCCSKIGVVNVTLASLFHHHSGLLRFSKKGNASTAIRSVGMTAHDISGISNFYQLAQELYIQGKFEEALQYCNKALLQFESVKNPNSDVQFRLLRLILAIANNGWRESSTKVDPFVKTGGRAVVRATFLLFLSLRCLFYNKSFVVPVE
jgi:hypothetical protein